MEQTPPKSSIAFDPLSPWFRDLHRLFLKFLPEDREIRLLEVGCYPGRYMWYFQRYWGYRVSGMEYIDWLCEQTQDNLQANGIEGEVIYGDLFSYRPATAESRWDVVVSLGLIEHFENSVEVIQKHLDLLKPGGYLVLVIPNHRGINGRILKIVSVERFKIHNRMGYEEIQRALERIDKVEIVEGGYYGRIGFWNTGLYAWVRGLGELPYLLVRSPLWLLEKAGRLIPNSQLLSPNAAVICKKTQD